MLIFDVKTDPFPNFYQLKEKNKQTTPLLYLFHIHLFLSLIPTHFKHVFYQGNKVPHLHNCCFLRALTWTVQSEFHCLPKLCHSKQKLKEVCTSQWQLNSLLDFSIHQNVMNDAALILYLKGCSISSENRN